MYDVAELNCLPWFLQTSALRHVQSNQCLDKASLTERDTPSLGELFKYSHLDVDCLQCFDAVGWASGRASGL